MGTWDTSLYGGDLPLDIKAEYYEHLYEGHTPEEAVALVWKELELSEEDLPVFRLILADVQWKLGQMTEDTLRNALKVLDSGAAMAEWEGASESDRRRERVLDRLRKKLESPQGPPKTVKRPKPKKFKYKIGDVISVQLVPELVKGKPEIEIYCNKYFMVQVVGYTNNPTSCGRYPTFEQCGDLVVLDWKGDAMPDMEAFGAAPMLDLKEALYWFTRSFIIAGMYGAKDVQCTVIGHAEVKFSQEVPECDGPNGIHNWNSTVLAIARAYKQQHSTDSI